MPYTKLRKATYNPNYIMQEKGKRIKASCRLLLDGQTDRHIP